jgi:hypothetical protein
MIHNALTGEPRTQAGPLSQPETDFTAGCTTAPVPDISIDDWDTLLRAVKSRLRLTGESLTQFNGAAAPMQASVQECVDALDQLHVTLSDALAAAQPTRIVAPALRSV